MPDSFAVLTPRTRDLGDFSVRRVLPGHPQQMVGPFIFFDHMGPLQLQAGRGVDVRPHPHIGLATVTYLFEGSFVHRDSLGTDQAIHPGDVNWMTAGRGIVHSERTPPDERTEGPRLHGIQTWVALPVEAEEVAPGFSHHPAKSLPEFTERGVRVRVIAGKAFGAMAPVKSFSPLLYASLEFSAGGALTVPPEHEERGVYLVDGEVSVGGQVLPPQHLLLPPRGRSVTLESSSGARVLLLGGAHIAEPRYIWWNFVSSSKDRIEQAKKDWDAERMGKIAGDDERIPLPER
jgi:redox-sensitive bicupin YhaK (pirin superfamily)